MKRKGFTLIELLITLSILAILLAFAWPSFMQLRERIKYDTTRHSWITFLNTGRSNAISLQSSVIACPFDFAKNACSEQLHGDWLMFTDDNKNKHLDETETSLRVMNVSDETSFWFYPNDRRYIRFYDRPNGIYGGLMGSFSICPNGLADRSAVHIKVNIMGRVASSTSRDANGIIMRESGSKASAIHC